MKNYGYVRKSEEREDYQIQSPKIQREWLAETEKILGIKIDEIFEDHKSAKKPDNRPNFDRMMKELRKGDCRILTIKANRICRNMKEGGEIIHLLENEYIKEIITRDGNYYPYTDTSVLAGQFAMATQFSKTLSKDVTSGMNRKAKEVGKWMWRQPTGYKNKIDERTRERFIVHDEERMPHIKKMFKLAMQGYSQTEIVEILYQDGLRSRPIEGEKIKKGPGKVDDSTISNLLKNKFFCGMVRTLTGEWVKGEHEGVISPTEFEILQLRFDRKFVRQERLFPFRGLMRCGECNSVISSQVQKGHVYYFCNKGKKVCHQKYIREEALGDLFFEYLKTVDLPKELADLGKFAVVNTNNVKRFLVQFEADKVAQKKARLQDRLYGLIKLRADGEISLEDMQKIKAETEKELEDLKEEEANGDALNKQQLEFSAIWIELLNSFSSSYFQAPAVLKNIILKIVGLNWTLKDGKVACERLNPLIEIAQNAPDFQLGGPGWT